MWSMLKAVWRGWQKVAHRIGNFQARVILTAFYLAPTLPFALLLKMSSDPLGLRQKQPNGSERIRPTLDLERARRQL